MKIQIYIDKYTKPNAQIQIGQWGLRSQTMKPEIEADVSHGRRNLSPLIQLSVCSIENTNTQTQKHIDKYTKKDVSH